MMRLFKLYFQFSKCAQSKNGCEKTIEKIYNKILGILSSEEGFDLFAKYDFIFENVYIITRQVLPELMSLEQYKQIMDEMKLKVFNTFEKGEEEDFAFLQRKFHALEMSIINPQQKIWALFDIFKEAFELIPKGKVDFNETRMVYHRMAIVLSNLSAYCITPEQKNEIKNVLDVYFDYEKEFANEHFDPSIIEVYLDEIIKSFNYINGLSPKEINYNFSECQESLTTVCALVRMMIDLRNDPFVGEKYLLENNGSYELVLLLLNKIYNKLKPRKKLFGANLDKLECLISILKYNSAFNFASFEDHDDKRIQNILTIINNTSLNLSDKIVQSWSDIITLLKYFDRLDKEQLKTENRLFWMVYSVIKYFEIEFYSLSNKKQKKELLKQIEYLRKYSDDILLSQTMKDDIKSHSLTNKIGEHYE